MTPPQRLHSVGNSLSKKVIPVTCDPDGRLERRPLADLTPFQGNLKDLDDARYAKLKASILAEGFMAPVFVWQDKILDGHQRTTVLNGEGWDVEGGVPVIEIQADTEADAARKLLKLTSAYGKPQPEGVFDFMQAHELDIGDLADVDLPDFDEDALLAMLGEGDPQEEPTDEIPEPPVEPVTRTGDLWHMGKHRVLCGDSCEPQPWAPRCVVTSPPYFNMHSGIHTGSISLIWCAWSSGCRRPFLLRGTSETRPRNTSTSPPTHLSRLPLQDSSTSTKLPGENRARFSIAHEMGTSLDSCFIQRSPGSRS